jgi:hypothetical protein
MKKRNKYKLYKISLSTRDEGNYRHTADILPGWLIFTGPPIFFVRLR